MTALAWHESKIPTIREAQKESGPGRCMCCGEPLRYSGCGRYPTICGALDCTRLYHQLYAWWRRRRGGSS